MSDPRYPIGRFVVPEHFSHESRAECMALVEAAPARLRDAVAGLSTTQLTHPYRDGGWTVAQVVNHLADSHMNAYVRFKLAMSADNPPITAYDEAKWAQFADATSIDLRPSLGLLDALHLRWVTFLRSLDGPSFDRTFRHSVDGPISLNRALALYAWHGRHHTAHITGLRERMGW